MGLIRFVPKIFLKKGSLPIYLTFFVNSTCNLQCKHCFFWKELEKPREKALSLGEINKVSQTLGQLLVLCLTGGEPFLRKDIPEIAKVFLKNNDTRILSITTNGFNTDFIVAEATRLLQSYHGSVILEVSLDGIGEVHDKIRGVEGAFRNAVSTFIRLKELKQRHKNLNVAIATTISKQNQECIVETIDYIASLGPDAINLALTRGGPRDSSLKQVDMKKYLYASRRLESHIKKRELKGYLNLTLGSITSANSIAIRDWVYKTKKGKYIGECYAGTLKGVIYSNGDVYPCEMLPKACLGNLRQEGYDFAKIWHGRKAADVRRWIKKTKCSCTHEGDISVNTLFNPRILPRVLLKSAGIMAREAIIRNK